MKHNGQNRLLLAMLVGIILGAILGGLAPHWATKVAFLGTLFLNALKMIIIPLILCTMVVGIASLGDIRHIGLTGWRTLVYYIATTCLSVILGLILVNIIRPGYGFEAFGTANQDLLQNITGTGLGEAPHNFFLAVLYIIRVVFRAIVDILITMVPSNIVKAMSETQVLPLILFSLVFGGVLSTIGDRGKPVLAFFEGVNEIIMKMVHLILLFAPLGVFGLVADQLGEAGGWSGFLPELDKLAKYAITVLLGLLIHGAIILPIILAVFGRRNPWRYGLNVVDALTTAFSTASSSATLPVTMEAVEQKNKISNRISSFVLPLGATINMDGTALYEAVAAMFIAQAYGITLGLGPQIIIVITATLAAIGAAGIPQAGLVTMVIVLQSVGLPLEGIGMILTIDWFLDRCRTTVNVWGDMVGAAVVDRLENTDIGNAPAKAVVQ
jgi:solute carrier family 1 (high affinity glutamate transporter) protein 1